MTYEDKSHRPSLSNSKPALLEPVPTASVHANIKIAHVYVPRAARNAVFFININLRQLRDLIVCPGDRGVVWYVGHNCVVEHDILDADAVSPNYSFFFGISSFFSLLLSLL